ncbi:MAG TPA: hypothetical protein PKA20_28270 [Burkholderiaceae bacterium]|nr:hypothetical protein [Burkholderiaceae bacterium]
MSADTVIARFAGEALARGVASHEVIAATRRLHDLARMGLAVEIELCGVKVYLPRTIDAPSRGRMER